MAEEKVQLKPVYDVPRTKCPFYGFHYAAGFFMDSEGNQCPLITDRYAPCQMEIAGKAPDWKLCGFRADKNEKVIEEILANAKIGPKEFWPKGTNSWKGIPFKDWMNYISNYKQKTEDGKKEDIETKMIVELGTDATRQMMI